MHDAGNFAARFQPFGDRDGGCHVLLQADIERADAAQAEIGFLRTRRRAECFFGIIDVLGGACVMSDRTQHRIGVADDVFGRRLDRHVGAKRKGLAQKRARPGVVGKNEQILFAGDLGDRRNVLHLEGLGARAFHKDEACVGFD